MRLIIDYRAELDRYNLFLSESDVAFVYSDEGIQAIKVDAGGEMPVFMSLHHEFYHALVDGILKAESPRLAEAALLNEMLGDARTVRDRLLAIVEGIE